MAPTKRNRDINLEVARSGGTPNPKDKKVQGHSGKEKTSGTKTMKSTKIKKMEATDVELALPPEIKRDKGGTTTISGATASIFNKITNNEALMPKQQKREQ
jgi:hypothetical protein